MQIQLPPPSNTPPQSEENIINHTNITPSNSSQPLSIQHETGTNTPTSIRGLKSPKSMDDMPPNLALHMRKYSSTHSNRNLMKSKRAKIKRQLSKSIRNDSKSNKSAKSVPAVEHTRQLSITTHATLS